MIGRGLRTFEKFDLMYEHNGLTELTHKINYHRIISEN